MYIAMYIPFYDLYAQMFYTSFESLNASMLSIKYRTFMFL